MIWIILLISLFLPIHSWAGFSVSGVTDPANVAGVVEPASVAGVESAYGCTGYNCGFAEDPNCKALWRFDDDALTTDSVGTNTFTNDGVDEELVDYREGDGCGEWVAINTDYMYRTDANWVGPWKSDDAVKTGSVCAWVKFASRPDVEDLFGIFTKYNNTAGKRSFAATLEHYSSGIMYAKLILGYNNGDSFEAIYHASNLSLDTWYHITWTYQNSDKAYAIRVRDVDGNVVGTDKTGTATLDANKLNVEDVQVEIGSVIGATVWCFDGLIDELAVFDDIITADEATQIAKGIYGQ